MKKLKFVAYYRVSTEKQGRSGLGMEAQQDAVARQIKERNGRLLAEYREVESGKKSQRPELERAIKRCRLSGATLVIAKLDRLSRNIAFITSLQESKIDFVCADMPEANTLTIHMMAALAQYERERISERTKEALAVAKRRGTVLGNPYLDDVRNTDTTAARAQMVANAQERNNQVRELIAEYEVEEGRELSGRELADRLNEAGYTTTRGKAFSHTQVLRIRTN